MAPCSFNLWIFCGILFLHYSVLASDKPTSQVDTDDKHSNDDVELEFNDIDVPQDVSDDAGDILDDNDGFWYDKRNIGRWRNANWLYGKRNLGRWRNRNWQNSQRLLQLSGFGDGNGNLDNYYGHNIKKRFTEGYGDEDRFIDDDDTGIQFGAIGDLVDADGVPGLGYFDNIGYNPYPSELDKRQASRWNYIHRKLSNLSRNNKRGYGDDGNKRASSRWRYINSKLRQLDGKRSLGRWRNFNWQHGGRQ